MNASRTSLIGLPLVALLGLTACARETESLPPVPEPTPVVVPVVVQMPDAAADAKTVSLSAQLSGGNEVPPVSTQASGTLEASLVPGSQVLSWTLRYEGLSGPLTGAHFHGPAQSGQNSGVAVPMKEPLTSSPLSGSVTLSAAQMAELRAGSWYVNLHTAAHPDGEIRGQVQIRP